MPSMLLVLTGSDHWTLDDGTRHPTGFWAEELLTPLSLFEDAGVEVTIATPGGARPTVDETSLSPDMVGGEDVAADLRRALEARSARLGSPARLEDVAAADYDGVFIAGGHGPMEDLAVSPALGALLVSMLDDDKVVAAVCHGTAALLPATRPDGAWAFAGRNLSGFSNEEETQAGLADQAPWLLADRVREAGGAFVEGPAWQPFAVVDDNVVTGQNPASSADVARHAVEQLGQRKHKRRRIEVPPSDHEAFTRTVAELADIDADAAERATEATLRTLGERISEGEAEDLARHLPDSLAGIIVQPGGPQAFPADEFFQRVAEREGTDPETAERHAAAVVAALARREGRKELHDMMSQLPRELRDRLLVVAQPSAARR
jgi:putative intracellular protease/amidase/uncharacterized protein (DUF2267 family)